ncbi:UNKNOWN [Stylonychia lemnae]|uniref:Uncharacterized protein n=1 Tax=Stylonychia lemnae TaxID=5949 RepID=A0A077ZW50_STYLE|nr:UNKNOWN [Stylonychia lemnae]|eukprot:CDW73801.1 UNKNOWN [Stylonychia lemnae]
MSKSQNQLIEIGIPQITQITFKQKSYKQGRKQKDQFHPYEQSFSNINNESIYGDLNSRGGFNQQNKLNSEQKLRDIYYPDIEQREKNLKSTLRIRNEKKNSYNSQLNSSQNCRSRSSKRSGSNRNFTASSKGVSFDLDNKLRSPDNSKDDYEIFLTNHKQKKQRKNVKQKQENAQENIQNQHFQPYVVSLRKEKEQSQSNEKQHNFFMDRRNTIQSDSSDIVRNESYLMYSTLDKTDRQNPMIETNKRIHKQQLDNRIKSGNYRSSSVVKSQKNRSATENKQKGESNNLSTIDIRGIQPTKLSNHRMRERLLKEQEYIQQLQQINKDSQQSLQIIHIPNIINQAPDSQGKPITNIININNNNSLLQLNNFANTISNHTFSENASLLTRNYTSSTIINVQTQKLNDYDDSNAQVNLKQLRNKKNQRLKQKLDVLIQKQKQQQTEFHQNQEIRNNDRYQEREQNKSISNSVFIEDITPVTETNQDISITISHINDNIKKIEASSAINQNISISNQANTNRSKSSLLYQRPKQSKLSRFNQAFFDSKNDQIDHMKHQQMLVEDKILKQKEEIGKPFKDKRAVNIKNQDKINLDRIKEQSRNYQFKDLRRIHEHTQKQEMKIQTYTQKAKHYNPTKSFGQQESFVQDQNQYLEKPNDQSSNQNKDNQKLQFNTHYNPNHNEYSSKLQILKTPILSTLSDSRKYMNSQQKPKRQSLDDFQHNYHIKITGSIEDMDQQHYYIDQKIQSVMNKFHSIKPPKTASSSKYICNNKRLLLERNNRSNSSENTSQLNTNHPSKSIQNLSVDLQLSKTNLINQERSMNTPIAQNSSQKFIKPMKNGKIVVGGKSITIKQYHDLKDQEKLKELKEKEQKELQQKLIEDEKQQLIARLEQEKQELLEQQKQQFQVQEQQKLQQLEVVLRVQIEEDVKIKSQREQEQQEVEKQQLINNNSISTQTFIDNQSMTLLTEPQSAICDWTTSRLYEKMREQNLLNDLQSQIDLVIEADIQNEDDAEKHTLFYHYKKSRKIYSQVECQYHANILKKKYQRKDVIDEEHLYDIYFIALKTLGALMNLLMLYPQWRRLEETYSNPQNINVQNTIKVLIRAFKMYEANTQIMKIIDLIIKQDQLKAQINSMIVDSDGLITVINQQEDANLSMAKHMMNKNEIKPLQLELNRTCSRILTSISILQEEHRIFKRPFIIYGMDYIEQLQNEIQDLQNQFAAKYIYVDSSVEIKKSIEMSDKQ